VTAVALPVGVAYAQLAGFNPAVGLLLKHSAACCIRNIRHVATVMGPDAATIPDLMLLRFNSPVVFFNAPYAQRSRSSGRFEGLPSFQVSPPRIIGNRHLDFALPWDDVPASWTCGF
jgi:hypothetical protein